MVDGILSGSASLQEASTYVIHGHTTSQGLGVASDVGDFDGDGQKDLLLGTYQSGDGGAYILFGSEL